VMTVRDVEKMTTLLEEEVKKVSDLSGKINKNNPSLGAEFFLVVSRMREVLFRMKKYLSREVDRLK